MFCCAGCERVYEILNQMDDAAKASYLTAARQMGLVPSDIEPTADPGITQSNAALPEDRSAIRVARFHCEGMVCPSCGWVVEQVLGSAPGVRRVAADFFSGSAKVTYDLRETSDAALIAHLSPLGYRLSRITDSTRTGASRRATLDLIISAVLTMNLMTLSFARYAEGFGWIDAPPAFLAWIEMLLLVPVLYIGWIPMVRRAMAALKRGRMTMDFLISIAVGAAAVLSVAAMITHRPDIYFETCAGLVTISLLSGMIEARIRERAFSDLAPLLSLSIIRVRSIDPDGNERYLDVNQVVRGDQVRFFKGETIPFDGEVVSDRAFVSEAVLTGEPVPRRKVPGDFIAAGSKVVEGQVSLTVVRQFKETRLHAIASSVAETMATSETRLRSQDRIAAWFAPTVLAIAAGAWLVRLAAHGIDAALSPAGWFPSVAVLAVACPCAFSLAGICAVTAATGTLLKKGILVKDLAELEILHTVNHVIFDKTGTVTQGEMNVDRIAWRNAPRDASLELVLAAERGSDHPIAQGIRAYLTDAGITEVAGADAPGEDLSGQGRSVTRGDQTFAIGSAALFDDLFEPLHLTPGHTAVWFGRNGRAEGCFLFTDKVRPNTKAAIAGLNALGLTTELVSGDRDAVTQRVAEEIGIPQATGDVSVDQKKAVVNKRKSQGKTTAFVGDGTNDALAMDQATVSIALSHAADEALVASGFVALSKRPESLLDLFTVGKKLTKVIKTNYLWAFAFNTVFIPVAAMGKLVPVIAMLLMLASATAVLLNSLRVRR